MDRRGRSVSPRPPPHRHPSSDLAYTSPSGDDNFLNPRQLEQFGRTVQATASQLISFPNSTDVGGRGSDTYRTALSSLHRAARRPAIQRSVFSFAKANPRELIRSNFNAGEIEQRARAFLPDDLIRNAPVGRNPYSLFEGFKASLPDEDDEDGEDDTSAKENPTRQKLLQDASHMDGTTPNLTRLRREKSRLAHRLEMMGVRKTMCASEIREIDAKIANLNTMRQIVLERLAGLESEERELELELNDVADRVEELNEDEEPGSPTAEGPPGEDGFMSQSIYAKLPSSPTATVKDSPRRRKTNRMGKRTISTPVLHEHMEPGTRIRGITGATEAITALDFDAPFGTLVTASRDDSVRVWDLNTGRCVGALEGHLSSVRCLQVEGEVVATGSMDASIRLWDLGRVEYDSLLLAAPAARDGNSISSKPSHGASENEEAVDADDSTTGGDDALFTPKTDSERGQAQPSQPPPSPPALPDCHVFTLAAHVDEVTALTLRGSTLVSGSADKTLRQWDLEKGRCVQTLDVLWAAAQQQASASLNHISSSSTPTSEGKGGGGWWRPAHGRVPETGGAAAADFVGALQVFDAALACGTADGMVRLWDLRSGMVHRSLVGHTGPVTALQFDDVFLVTGSLDRSVRVWDLRTGGIHDAYAYDQPVTSMMFDARRIVAAAGEGVVKVYDKTDGRHWDCGAGSAVVERVRIRDGYLVEGRSNGEVGVWSC
ncbi:MAG: hypothetical protein FE78DRAFT_75740 [Acidomyces sp. 'richmondensis']|nr:MAG: hypothetical protein FE78DRAFT_75740 [Acidomyces sp. 'richmondensis']